MARQAELFFQDRLADYLEEGDDGYSFSYGKEYLENPNPKLISLTLPISKDTYHSNVLFSN